MGLFNKIGNAIKTYNENVEKEEQRKKEEAEANKFITINDDETHTTKYQCPKCKGYDIDVDKWVITADSEGYGNYVRKSCNNCGHSHTMNTDFPEEY